MRFNIKEILIDFHKKEKKNLKIKNNILKS